jgi:uncharacterized protein YbjT (DUF2867 family)
MNVIIFGVTGMVGQAALRESLLDPAVERVLAIGRSPAGQKHEKLRELILTDLTDYTAVSADLAGYDACFFCLGVSSSGMSEGNYRRVTVDIAAAAGRALVAANPAMTFIFVSGTGTDSTGRSRTMWARVKGEAENAIFALPFKAAYAFRPSFIRPMHGITSRTRSYRVMYAMLGPLVPAFVALFPRHATTTEKIGRAMLNVARHGAPKRVLDTPDINAAAETTQTG